MPFSSSHSTGNVLPGQPDESAPAGERVGRTLRGLFLLLACCVLVGSYLVAGLAYEQAEGVRAEQRAQRTEVTATLLESARGSHQDGYEPARATTQVRARWTAADGTTSTGLITVDSSAAAGDQRPVWVTSSGEIAPPPMTRMQTSLLGLGAGVGVSATALALAFGAYRLPQRLASWRRMRALEEEWADVEPEWSCR